MKKSISIWSFWGDWDLRQKMVLAKESGFEGFELELTEEGIVSLASSFEDHIKVKDLANEVGIQLSGLATGLYWSYNGASEDAELRSRTKHVMEKQIRIAADLGVDSILVIPGSVGADFINGCEEIRYDLVWERATQIIESAIPLAESEGVNLCIENVWNKFLLSPIEMARFVDQFSSSCVKVYFDVGNALLTGYPEHWIQILGQRIDRIHFKDYRRNVGTADGFVEILSGDVNWSNVMEAIRNVEYDGWVTAEMIPPVPFYKHHPEVLIKNTSTAMDSLLCN